MVKNQGGGKLHPLPFTTFGEAAALGFEPSVYCSRCYEHRSIDHAAEHLRDRCFATARFRCTKIRYTGDVCGYSGSVVTKPSMLLPVGGEDTLAFLYCSTCEPSWEINRMPIDKPPWSVLDRKGNDRFKCPGVGRPWPGVSMSRAGGRVWRRSMRSIMEAKRKAIETVELVLEPWKVLPPES